MAEIYVFPTKCKIADDTAPMLREIADAVERGEISELALVCVNKGEYDIRRCSSLTDTIVLANLLLDCCLRGMLRG